MKTMKLKGQGISYMGMSIVELLLTIAVIALVIAIVIFLISGSGDSGLGVFGG